MSIYAYVCTRTRHVCTREMRTRTRRARQVRAHREARSDNMYVHCKYTILQYTRCRGRDPGRTRFSVSQSLPAYARLSVKPSSFFPPPVYRVIRKTARAGVRVHGRRHAREFYPLRFFPNVRINGFFSLFFCHDFHVHQIRRPAISTFQLGSSVDLQRDPEDGRYKMRFYFASFVHAY